ncbi:MAG: metal ABC transporter permease [Flavobacteriales bacterium]|nr:metal ABC transporter permease [Flavobacteriales bacterium]
MNDFVHGIASFFGLTEPNVRVVFWGSLILCSVSGLVGTFTFLRKRALMGDVISHSVLPGIALAYMISHQKNPMYLIIGAVITGWVSTFLVDYITKNSKIKNDTAIALVLSVFFGIGVMLLVHIQHSGSGSQSGLDNFIFGKASAMTKADVWLFALAGSVIISVILIFFRGFSTISFDEAFAQSIGFPLDFLRFVLAIATVATVAMGVQAVGVVLMSALLITPAAAARFWTNKIGVLALLSVLFAGFSGVFGAAISYTYNGMPTGPWIVVVISLIALFSAFFGSKTGMTRSFLQRKQNDRKILIENTIKLFYGLTDAGNKLTKTFLFEDILNAGNMKVGTLKNGLNLLLKHRYITLSGNQYLITPSGFNEAKAIVRKHRLWELYISKFMNLDPDHVHDDAEGIEHIITPEIEKELEKELNFPKKDPHDSDIPY